MSYQKLIDSIIAAAKSCTLRNLQLLASNYQNTPGDFNLKLAQCYTDVMQSATHLVTPSTNQNIDDQYICVECSVSDNSLEICNFTNVIMDNLRTFEDCQMTLDDKLTSLVSLGKLYKQLYTLNISNKLLLLISQIYFEEVLSCSLVNGKQFVIASIYLAWSHFNGYQFIHYKLPLKSSAVHKSLKSLAEVYKLLDMDYLEDNLDIKCIQLYVSTIRTSSNCTTDEIDAVSILDTVGEPNTLLYLAEYYKFNKDYTKSFNYYHAAYNYCLDNEIKPHSSILYNLGYYYELGIGVSKDITRAVYLYKHNYDICSDLYSIYQLQTAYEKYPSYLTGVTFDKSITIRKYKEFTSGLKSDIHNALLHTLMDRDIQRLEFCQKN